MNKLKLSSKVKLKLFKNINYEAYTKILFKELQGYKLDLDSPKTFNEKIQWMKFNGNLELCGKYVDKNEVREFVKEKVGQKYLIDQLGCYSEVESIVFENLPEQFVIKATHASGWNILVKDRLKIDVDNIKSKISDWLNSSFYKLTGESNYRDIKPKIVIEDYIKDSSGDLKDYKFFCFDGKAEFIQLDSNRFKSHTRDLYDLEWNKLPVKLAYPNLERLAPKPEGLTQMIEVAEKLASDFNFVRVDLYNADGIIYFGELTFTPGNGMEKFDPIDYDYKFGEKFELRSFDENWK